MDSRYKKAFKELDYILKNTETETLNKIPDRFIKYMKNNMDDSYTPNIKHNTNLENQDLLEETKELMAIVYRDYLVNNLQRKSLLENEKYIKEKIEAEKREKYKIKFKPQEVPKQLITIKEEKSGKWDGGFFQIVWKKILEIKKKYFSKK